MLAWTLPDHCSDTLKTEYKKMEEIQKNFAAQMDNLRQQVQAEILKRKQEEAAAVAKAERETAPQAPASGSAVPMETDDLAQHFGSDDFNEYFGANLAEGIDVAKFSKHLLEMVTAKEAKRRKKG